MAQKKNWIKKEINTWISDVVKQKYSDQKILGNLNTCIIIAESVLTRLGERLPFPQESYERILTDYMAAACYLWSKMEEM